MISSIPETDFNENWMETQMISYKKHFTKFGMVWNMVAFLFRTQNVNMYCYVDYMNTYYALLSMTSELGTHDTKVHRRSDRYSDQSSNWWPLGILTLQITNGSCQTSQNRPLVQIGLFDTHCMHYTSLKNKFYNIIGKIIMKQSIYIYTPMCI